MYIQSVRTATVAELIATLEQHVKQEPGGAIAFDGDGTLWSGDIGEDFFEALLDTTTPSCRGRPCRRTFTTPKLRRTTPR